MLRGLTCKDEYTSNLGESREVFQADTLNFARIFCAVIRNFLAFTAFFFALPHSCQHKRKTVVARVKPRNDPKPHERKKYYAEPFWLNFYRLTRFSKHE